MIKEDFLHYLWKLKKIDFSDLITSEGEDVTILDFGKYNTDSGPDFFNARVKINDTIWAGNIEMHVFSSDWIKHKHHNDPAYNNVILHVVYEEDIKLKSNAGGELPTIVLKNRIFKNDLKNYKLLRFNKNWIPCEKAINEVSSISKENTLEKALTDRLINKSSHLKSILEEKKDDWDEAFYIFLSRYFGMKTNSDAFEALAKKLPYKIILKEKDDLNKIEALLFGQAGMLQDIFSDEYPLFLKNEYQHLRNKYDLTHIPPSMWKFSKLRPSNFPTIRISQLAYILFNQDHLFRNVFDCNDINCLLRIFKAQTSAYWENHYIFDEKSINKKKYLGKNSIEILIINAVIPALFFFGHLNNEPGYKERAVDLLMNLSPENNSIIKKWKDLDIEVKSAYDSQALLELKQNYCDKKRCLECPIGNEIMNK
ncbi:MAG TPA: DUF2851 family protein [Bacteroidetes bacterium]|nr:DUF2851 family protein [Bacteroidota bacterium]